VLAAMDPRLCLDFTPGITLANQVRSKFSTPIHSLSPNLGFHLVVSFGRSTFRLDESYVANAVEACTGGIDHYLQVYILRDHVFRFTVCSKALSVFSLQISDHTNANISHVSSTYGVLEDLTANMSNDYG
jgi:hypothetical protein